MSRATPILQSPSHLSLKEGDLVTLSPGPVKDPLERILYCSAPQLPVGSQLGPDWISPCFQKVESFWLPGTDGTMQMTSLLRCLASFHLSAGEHSYSFWKSGYTLASITLSDKAHSGLRSDESGPLIHDLVNSQLSLTLALRYQLPDETGPLKSLLSRLALELGVDLIITTGGTGLTSRDITPEATGAILEKELPAFEQAMNSRSLSQTPHAALSRARAGVLGKGLILNLPGKSDAVKQALDAVLPAFRHALDKLNDDPTDCESI